MKMQYLTRTCKKLKILEICGTGIVGDSLTSALPLAKSLETLSVGANCEIKLASVLLALKSCQKTILEATFLRVEGRKIVTVPEVWPQLHSLQSLNLRASGGFILGEVSLRKVLLY
jgi:F-box/TPR repeat protein Pof3